MRYRAPVNVETSALMIEGDLPTALQGLTRMKLETITDNRIFET